VRYIPPFAVIRDSVEITQRKGAPAVTVAYDQFLSILIRLISDIDIDETWYLSRYDDVAEAIAAGRLKSAKEHYITAGFFEGRQPYQILVDERWYLKNNPDVAENLRLGLIASAQAHFDENGYNEGRLPFDPLA